jgi:transcriptional regulator with XRE-family HTH domain
MPYKKPETEEGKQSAALRIDLGKWLKAKREAADLTMLDVANACDLAYYSYVGSIERGDGTISSKNYAAYARVLGIDCQEFVKRLLKAYDPIAWDILFGSGKGIIQLPRK